MRQGWKPFTTSGRQSIQNSQRSEIGWWNGNGNFGGRDGTKTVNELSEMSSLALQE
jgi:hypothetical protein